MKLEVVADAAHGQPEPAAGRIVDDNHWLVVKYPGQPWQPVRPRHGLP